MGGSFAREYIRRLSDKGENLQREVEVISIVFKLNEVLFYFAMIAD